jgi:hypothetical protein
MRRRSTIPLSALAILAVSGFAGSRMAVPMARPALGFIAKVVCSNVFLGGVTLEQVLADLPDEPLARVVRTRIDPVAGTVTASVPLVAKRQAVYRDGLGCTLIPADDATAPPPAAEADGELLWPDGERAGGDNAIAIRSDRLNAAIEDAFVETDAALPRRTRAIVIVHGGRIVAERYADGYGSASLFTGWSMTKSVTNALVGILTAQNALDIDADRLRPEWRSPDDPRSAITLHDLLTMSSGLGFDESYAPSGAATRMLFDSHDAAAVAADSPLLHDPGTVWSYSSATTNIVSAVVRDAFKSHDEYIAFPRRALATA